MHCDSVLISGDNHKYYCCSSLYNPRFSCPSSSPHSVSLHRASGDHRRVQQEPRRQRGRRHGQVQGGQRQVSEVVRDAGGGEAGQLLLLQLLEGQGATTGMAVPQHQPPLLLLLLIRKRRLDMLFLHVHEHKVI